MAAHPAQITPAGVSVRATRPARPGLLSAARVRIQFDIWSFPFEPQPPKPARQPVQITHQTGQVLTPTAAPNGRRTRVPVRQRRARQSLGDGHAQRELGRSRSKRIPRLRWACRSGRPMDDRSRSSRRRGRPGTTSGSGSSIRTGGIFTTGGTGSRGGVVTRQPVALLRPERCGCAQQGLGELAGTNHGQVGADAEHHRAPRGDAVLHWSNASCSTAVRS